MVKIIFYRGKKGVESQIMELLCVLWAAGLCYHINFAYKNGLEIYVNRIVVFIQQWTQNSAQTRSSHLRGTFYACDKTELSKTWHWMSLELLRNISVEISKPLFNTSLETKEF